MSIVSKRVRYALHGLAFLARHDESEDPVPFEMILAYLRAYSQRLTLSPSYIAKVFQDVSRAGLTVAVPGPHGGYRLAAPAEKLSLIKVVEALDGPLGSECCLLSVGNCTQQGRCGVRLLVQQAESAYYDFFAGETVASLSKKMTFPDLDRPVGENPPPIQIGESGPSNS
ncbi:MAG: RrF2 family transcriptional regulator [Thermoanaerobaculia bacterium]